MHFRSGHFQSGHWASGHWGPTETVTTTVVYESGTPRRKSSHRKWAELVDETLHALVYGEEPPEEAAPDVVAEARPVVARLLREQLEAASVLQQALAQLGERLARRQREWEEELQDEEDLLRLL